MGWNAVYGRISKDKEGRQEKVETQVDKGRRYCVDRWPDVEVREYVDNDLSAADPGVFRPDYDRLLHDIRAGHVEHVVCAEQSRLTRQPSEWEDLVVILTRAGIREVHQYRGGIVQVEGSKLVGRILAAVDAEEVERLRARINDRLGSLAEEGRPHGGRIFAYRHILDPGGKKTIEPDPARAEIVRQTAERITSGWSLTSIAADLNRRGVPTARGGKEWTASSVRSMVTNPAVAAYRPHRGRLIPGNWKPVLDRDVWYHVRHLLEQPFTVQHPKGPHRGTRTRVPRRSYLLTGGIAVCGLCRHPLSGQQRQNRQGERSPSYHCHPSKGGCSRIAILGEPLEQHVADEMFREMERRYYHQELATDDNTGRRARLSAELSTVEGRRSEMSAMYAVGELTEGEWAAARRALADRMSSLSADLASLPARIEPVDPVLVRRGWKGMTLEEKRQLVVIHVKSVTVNPARPGTRGFDEKRVLIDWI